jgi:DNA repair photolyase
MKPIYTPSGAAKEYGDYALNIYTGCPHRCYYCFAPSVLRKDREAFHSCVEPRAGIVEATRKQLEAEHITGKLIHLCFTCDPYPSGYDSTATREIIKLLKDAGNHVQILTKGDGSRDFDLLDENDWYGISISCNTDMQRTVEPNAMNPLVRLLRLEDAKQRGIKTWVSFEPVIDADAVLSCIAGYFDVFDKIKIGKLNYHPSKINWKEFGKIAESVCIETGVPFYIKDSLRKEMEAHHE